ncbi:MAG: Lrp/AsnC family transcriptional regulator, partial [Promethearchaeota archaeon]
MTKLDLKDRKILYALDLDCRQSNSQIGKKVGLKRDVVSYRIKKMQDEGVINNFWTFIDTFKLGYNVFRVYINLQYVSSDIKDKIIKYFVDYPKSWVVATVKAEIDLAVILWVNDIYEFYQFWEKTLDQFEEYFAKNEISIYIQAIVYKKSFLLQDGQDKLNREMFKVTCEGKPVSIDELDYKILNEIAVNARVPLIDLASKLGCSSQSVSYRIKNLTESGVIKAFRVDLDLSKLGLQRYKPNIYLKDHRLKKPVFDYLKDKPYLEYMNLAIGWADLEPEFIVNDYNDFLKILDDINSKFSGAIKKQTFFIFEKYHKLRCLPELK